MLAILMTSSSCLELREIAKEKIINKTRYSVYVIVEASISGQDKTNLKWFSETYGTNGRS